MSYPVCGFILLFWLYTCPGYAKKNINKVWKDANPVKERLAMTATERIKIHEDYLEQSVAKEDITQQFFGNIYLYTDYMDEQNYPKAISFLLAAENIAEQSDNRN